MSEQHDVFAAKSGWYVSWDGGEIFSLGPFESEEEAEAERGQHGMVAYLTHTGLRLSDHFDADSWLQEVEESDPVCEMAHPDAGGDVFPVNKDHRLDLERRVRDAIDAWQVAHGLRFESYWFDKIEKQPAAGPKE